MSRKITVPIYEGPSIPKLAADIYGAYIMPNEGLILVGLPLLEDDAEHDCDAAGCSSVSHVVYRHGKPHVAIVKEYVHE